MLLKNIRCFILLTLLGISCGRQPNVIDYPVIESSNTTNMEIYGVEMTDTALVLHTEVYNRPNYWVRLSSQSYIKGNTTGKTYKLIGSPDFELDKEVYMPETWNKTATLLFEPVDKTEKIISFYDGEAEDDFRSEGIHLTKPTQKGKITCVIQGEVIDRPQSSRLTLMRKGKDISVSKFISIPIRNGKFSYTLTTDYNDAYELCFWEDQMNGAWRSVDFISENGTLDFTLYPMDKDLPFSIQTKAPLNNELINLTALLNSLFNNKVLMLERAQLEQEGRMYSDAYKKWRQNRDAATTGEERDKLYKVAEELEKADNVYSEEGKAINSRFEQLSRDRTEYTLNYIKEHLDFMGLYMLNNLICHAQTSLNPEPVSIYTDIFESSFRDTFEDYPIAHDIDRIQIGSKTAVNSKYIDFTAPDLKGNPVTLSEQIKGKIALIDLWASWCGPCRRTSISMIPIYEEYKDKGFTIVGVARERDNTAAMKKAIEKDKYPWLNLVELNDRGNIWYTYGVGNAAGATFLVDTDGTILAIHPTAEEVKAILKKKL